MYTVEPAAHKHTNTPIHKHNPNEQRAEGGGGGGGDALPDFFFFFFSLFSRPRAGLATV